jgi:hypothetical protein
VSRQGREPELSTDGHTDADAHARAEFLARLVRAAGPAFESLPSGPLKRDFMMFIRKHGDELGISINGIFHPKATLLDAKIELDARIEELGLPSYAASVSSTQYRMLAEGTSITREELEVVTPHTLGRHLRAAKGLPLGVVMAGHYACGVLAGALKEAWRY